MPVGNAGPIQETERIRSLDVLRGVALLGILLINIRYFAIPLRRLGDPGFPTGQLSASDFWVWLLGGILAEDKMIALFSALFGAGFLLLTQRLEGQGAPARKLYFRRIFWLFMIGMAHAYLLWFGDILMTYALCGIALWFLRKLPPWPLIALGCALVIFAPARTALPSLYQDLLHAPGLTSSPSRTAEDPAESPPKREAPRSPFSEEAQTEAYRGTYRDLARWRFEVVTTRHFLGTFSFDFWRCAGFMLIGMALFQFSFLSGSSRSQVYWGVLLGGLAVGLTLALIGSVPQWYRVIVDTSQWDPASNRLLRSGGMILSHMAPLFLCPAYISAVQLLSKRVTAGPLAAVGRMALTNYLMHTVICALTFEGWAFARWGTWGQTRLLVFVTAVWALQLVISPLWLRYFLYGPAEWAWRSLTYRKPQPMRR